MNNHQIQTMLPGFSLKSFVWQKIVKCACDTNNLEHAMKLQHIGLFMTIVEQILGESGCLWNIGRNLLVIMNLLICINSILLYSGLNHRFLQTTKFFLYLLIKIPEFSALLSLPNLRNRLSILFLSKQRVKCSHWSSPSGPWFCLEFPHIFFHISKVVFSF